MADLMNQRFKEHIDSLHPSFQRLMGMPSLKVDELARDMPTNGIYLFSEGSDHLYVGRSTRLRSRIKGHSLAGATHREAAFAFLLARDATGQTKASYKPEGSRSHLMSDPAFAAAFTEAKGKESPTPRRGIDHAAV